MKTTFIYYFIMILAVFTLSNIGYSQISFYSFSESTGNTFSSISATGTSISLGDDADIQKPIDFTFTYNGTDYTQLNIGSNAWLRLGSGAASIAGNSLNSTTYKEVIAPFWDDMNPSDGGDIYFETQGSSPNRIFIVEYNAVRRYSNSATLTVQALLYETSNNVEFRYGASTGTFNSASIGINEDPGSSSHYISVTPGSPATTSTSSANNSITAAPADGVNYLFTYTPPTCPAPTNQSVTTITSSGAKLNWTTGGASDYGVEYGPTGFTQGTGTYVAVATDEFKTISGLSSGTEYDWYVHDSCSAADVSTWIGPNTFKIAYAPIYNQDFASYTPTDWHEAAGRLKTNTSFSSTTSSNWTSDGFGNNGSSGSAKIYITSTYIDEWLISPSIDLSGGSYSLEFDIALTDRYNTNADAMGSDDSLCVVISTDNGATWAKANILKTYTSSDNLSPDGQHDIIDLSAYSTTIQIGFYAASSVSNTSYNIYIDNFGIVICPAPTALNVTNIAPTSAKLNWTGGGSTDYGVEYGPTGFTKGTGTYVAVATDEFFTINSLSFGTDYDWYVHDSCGTTDVSTWVGPNTFTTSCDVYSPAYNQNFDNYLPSCWTEAQGLLETNTSLTGTTSSWSVDGFANNGSTGSARFNLDGTSGDDWLISPSIDLSGGGYQLEFDIALTKYNGGDAEPFGADDSLVIVISTDDGTTWDKANAIKTFTSADAISNVGQHIIVDLSAYSTTVKLGFYAATTVDDNDKNVYIDNFKVQSPPACPDPNIQTVAGLTSTGADFGWTDGGGSHWDIYVVPTGDPAPLQATNPTVNDVVSNPYTYTGGSSNTTYDWYVRSDCDQDNSGTSSWIGPNTFKTIYAPIYNQDFASYTPTDWHEAAGRLKTNTSFSSTTSSNWESDGFGNHGSSGSAKIYITSTYIDEWLISPSIDLSGGSYSLEFDIALTDRYNTNADAMGSDDSLCVVISTDNGATWAKANILKTYTSSDNLSPDGQHDIIDLSAYSTTIQIGFYAASSVSNTSYNIYIDNFGIVTCPMATNQSESDIQALQAKLNWTSNGATNFGVEYGIAGFTKGTGTYVAVATDEFKIISGLTSETDYEWYVHDSCSTTSVSAWTGPSSFTTLATCPIPSDQKVTGLLSSTSVQLNWKTGGATDYNIEYGATGFTQGTGIRLQVVTDTFKVITGLTAETTYEWYVRDSCSATDISYWVGADAFTTSCTSKSTPWADDIETHSTTTNSNINECWSSSPSGTTSSYRWNVDGSGSTPSGSTNTGPSGANSDSKYFYTEANSGNSGDVAEIYSPNIDLSSLTVPMLEFYYHMHGADIGSLHVDLYNGTWHNDIMSVISGQQQSSASDAWMAKVVDLSTYSGTVQIRFRAERGAGDKGDICLDDITVKETPSCLDPTVQTVANITASGAELGWTDASGTHWDVYVVESGGTAPDQATAPTANDITANPYTYAVANANTTYDWYVRSDCDQDNTGTSAWVGSNSFTTPCAIISSFPWTEDFENAGSIPSCWMQDVGNSEDWLFATSAGYAASSDNTSGSGYIAWIDDSSPYNASPSNLLTPSFNTTSLTSPLLEFYYWIGNGNTTVSTLDIDVYDGTTWQTSVATYTANNGWVKAILDISSYSNASLQLRFSGTEDPASYKCDISIDDITIKEAPACPNPTAQTTANITASGANLGWTDASGSNWDVYVIASGGAAPDQATNPTDNDITTNPYTYAAGSANTTYDWYVRSDCDQDNTGTSAWVGASSFYTGYCSPNPSSVDNDGITNISFSTVNNTTGTEAGNYGDYSAMIGEGKQGLPLDVDITYETSYTYNTKIWVDWNDDLDFGDAGEEVYSGESSGSSPTTLHTTFTIPASASLGNHRMRIGGHDLKTPSPCSTESYGCYEDYTINVVIPPVNEIEVTQVIGSYGAIGTDDYTITATVKNNGTAANAVPINYTLDGAALVSETTASIAAFSSIDYTFTAQVSSGATGNHELAVFSTLASEEDNTNDTAYAIVANLTDPYSEDFDSYASGVTPDYWTSINKSGNSSAKVETQSSASYANSGTISLKLYNSGFNDTTKRAIIAVAPKLISGMSGKQARFYARGNGSYLIIGVMGSPTDTSTFVSVDTIKNPPTDPTLYTIPLDSYTGSGKYLAFRHGAKLSSKYFNIDDVNIEDIPSCPPPTNQVVEAITASGAKLLWSSGGATNANIEYGPTGFTQGGGTTFAIATDTFKVINSLTANTEYDWYVQDNCGPSNTSPWIGPSTFKTVYAPVYNQEFATYKPTDWSEATGRLTTNSSLSGTSSAWTADGFGNNGTAGSAKMEIKSTYKKEWLISPSFDLSGGSYQLEFDMALTYHSNSNADVFGSDDSLAVIISTDNGTTWSNANILQAFTSTNTISNTGDHILIDLSAYSSVVKIGFYAVSTVSNKDINVYIDNFGIITCPRPSNQIETELQALQVQLNWTSGGSSNYDIEYGDVGFTPGSGTAINVATDTFKVITSLSPENNYEWYVRDNCGSGDESFWYGPSSFTTSPTCPAPTNATETDLTSTSVKLNWQTGGATEFGVEYGPTGFTQGSGTYVAVITDEFKVITGLDANTVYDWYVHDSCGTTDVSTWVGANSFTTDCAIISSFPYTESFENNVPPTCWNELRNPTNASYGWTSITSGYQGKGAKFNSYYNSSGNTSELTTYTFDLSSLTAAKLNFVYKNPTGGDFSVLLSTDGGATYTNTLASGLTGQTSWLESSINITNYIGSSVVIKFMGTSNYGSDDAYIYLDEVSIESIPANEIEITQVVGTFGAIGSNDFTIEATIKNNGSAASTVPINYSLDDGAVTTETSPSIAAFSTANYTFTAQLNSGTVGTHKLAVYSTLAGDADNTNDTAYADVANIAYPYDNNFDSYVASDKPDYWTVNNTTGNTSAVAEIQSKASYAHSGLMTLKLYNSTAMTENLIAVLPKLASGLSGKQLSFWARGTGSDIIVGVMTDPNDVTTFAAVYTVSNPPSVSSQFNVNFDNYSGSGKYVAFKHGMTTTNDFINIDDVYLGDAPSVGLGNDTTICVGSSISLDAGTGSYSYSWTNNGHAAVIATTQVLNTDSVGTYVVKIDDSHLIDYDTIIITNYDLPTVALTGNNTICNGDSSQISMTFTGASPWDIVISANNSLQPQSDLMSPLNVYDDPSVTTEYFITEITDDNGCVQNTNSDSITITVNALPTINFAALNDACANDNVNIVGGTPASGWYSGNNVDSVNSTFDAVIAGVGIHPITYNYTDGNGCTNTAQQNQNVNSIPTVSFTALSEVCADAMTFSLSGGNPASGTYSGTGVGSGSFDPAIAGTGNHNVTYSFTDGNGCSDTAIQVQIVNSLPTVAITLTDVCADATTFSLSGGTPTGGTYSGTNVDGSGNFDPSNGTQTITYNYTDGNSCTNNANTSQIVNVLPDVTVTAVTNPVPYNSSTSLSADVTNGVGTLTYDWTPGVSVDDSTNQNPTTANITAAIDFSVEVTDGTTNCVNSNNLVITYSGGPVSVSPSSNETAICTGDTAMLNAGGAGGNATLAYTWTSNPSGFTSSSEIPNVMPSTDTWYIVEATDGTNTDKDSIKIIVNPLPVPTFAGLATTYCANDASSDLIPTPSGGIFTGSGVNGGAFNPSTAGAGSFDVTYSYTDGNGCASEVVNSTTVNTLPTVSFSGLASTYCVNNDDALLVANVTGGTFMGTGISGNTFSAATAGVGNHEIIYNYSDANGCANADTNFTIVNGLPNVQFSGLDADYCIDITKDTLVSLPTGGTFTGTGITANIFSPSTAGVGAFDIVYSYTDANNCTNKDTNSTIVNALPTLSFSGLDADYCIDGASSDLVGTPTGGSYTGTGILGTNFNPTTANIGTHDITYSFTDGNGCSNSVMNSTVVNALPTVMFTGLDATYCVDASDATLAGNPAGGTYSGTGINVNSFSPSTAGAGSFDIIYNYTDANSCSNSDTNSTLVNVLPIVTVNATTNPVAYNNSANISASVSNSVGTLSYSWSPASDISGSNTLQTITTNNITVATAFIGEVYDLATNCSNSDTVTILYNGGPVSVNPIASNNAICIGDTASLFAQSSGGTATVTYLWTSNPSGFSSTDENPIATPSQDSWYIVEATDGSTTYKDSVQIIVNALPTISFAGLDADYCVNAADATLSPTPIGGIFSGSGINSNVFSPSTAGVNTFDIAYTYTDANGCTNITTNTTVVNVLPSIQVTSLESDYCVDAIVDTLIGIPVGGTLSGTGIIGTTFDPAIAGVGNHNIMYSYTDANNCTNTDTSVTSVHALPTPSLTLTDVCVDASIFSLSGGLPTGGTYTGTAVDASGNFDPSQGAQTITYTYTDANSCSNTISTSQVVNALPIITATAAANPVAYNNSTTLSATVSNAAGSLTYNWSPSADINGSNTIQSVTTNSIIMANSYVVDVTDAITTCSNTDTIELTYTGGPVSVNPIAVPTFVCDGDNATVKAQSSGGTATVTYSWTSNPSGFTSTDASPVVTPTVDTWYYVSATDGTTTVDDSVLVSVNALPSVSFTGLAVANCESASVNNLVPSVSGGIFTGTGVNGSTFNPSVAGVGSFDITYSYTNANGCSNTAINSTVVNALPTISYTDNLSSVCLGDSVEAILNFTGTAPFSYNINGITISGINAIADSFYVSPIMTTTYLITSITDANCSSMGDIDSLRVIVNSLPTIVASNDATICNGDSTQISLNFTGAAPWSFDVTGGSNSFTESSATSTFQKYVLPNITTNYIVTSLTDGNNCSISGDIDSILISVNALPTVTASDNDSICIGDSSLISLTFTGAAPFNFSVYDGTNTFINNANTSLFQLYAGPEVTTMFVLKSIADDNGCSVSGDIDSVQVFINSLPTISFTGLDVGYCDNGLTDVLTGIPSGGTFNGSGVNGTIFSPINAGSGNHDIIYSYTDANGCSNADTNSTIVNVAPVVALSGLTSSYCTNEGDETMIGLPSGGSFTGATTNSTFSPSTLGIGSYTVYYSYTDANNCSNIDSALTIVNSIPTIAFTTLMDVCENTPAFIPTGASPVGGLWSGSEISGGWFIPVTSGIGTHYLTYSYTDVNGCTNNDSTAQVVNGIPTVSFTGLATTYCANAMNDTLVGSPIGGTYSGTGMTNDIFSPSVAGAGSYDIVYSYTAANACSNTDTVSTMVNALPIVSLGANTTICDNANITLDAGNGFTSYLWSTGAITQTINVDSIGLGIGSFDFSVAVTDNNTCSAVDSMELTFEATPISQLSDASICGEDENLTLTAGSNTNYSYLWSNGSTANTLVVDTALIGGASNYVYVAISSPAGCTDNDSAFVEFKAKPMVDLGADSNVCINHTIILDAGSGYTSYLWSTGSTTQTISIDSLMFNIGSNDYSVEVTNSVNCINSDTITLIVDPCTGVPTPELDKVSISVYPNPTSGKFQIDVVGLQNQVYNLEVYNSVGSVVYSDKIVYDGSDTKTWKLDFSSFAMGVYHIRLYSKGEIKIKRVVIQ